MAPSIPASGRKRIGAELAIAWLSLFGLLAILALFAYSIANDRAEIIWQTKVRARTEAIVLADHAARLFEAADLALTTVIDDTRGMNGTAIAASRRLHDRFRRLSERLPYVEAVWYYGPDGQLWMSSLAFPAPQMSATAEFHAVLRNRGPSATHVSPPVGDTFRLSHRIEDTSGAFKGVASLTINSSYFRSFYDDVDYPIGSVVTLLSVPTLDPLVRHAEGIAAPPICPLATRLREELASGRNDGIISDISARNWTDRYCAYRKLPDLPLVMVFGMPVQTMNWQWVAQARGRLVPTLGAIAALGLLTWLGFRQASRQRAFQDALTERVGERTKDLERALQEVHHRVNNNLQMVSTLLTMQLRRVADPSIRQALAEGVGRVDTIGLAHQVIYGSGSVTDLAFGDYLRALARQIGDLYGSEAPMVAVSGENPVIPLDKAVPLALMVHEVLATGLRSGRAATIDLRREDSGWLLVIAGLPPIPDTGMAAQIIALLADQLGAKLTKDADTMTIGLFTA